jgi:hypothetical protein
VSPASWRSLVLLALALVCTGCGEPPALAVGRIAYSEAELAGIDRDRREAIADLTAFGLAAADRRLAEVVAPFVQRDIRSILLQRAALELGAADAGLGEADLRRAYEEDPAFELTVRHLVVVSERWRPRAQRDSAQARVREAAARVRAGEPFERLVAEYSDEPGAAERGGLLRRGREGSWVPEFWAAALQLEPGEVSDVVETEFGFHLIRLEARDTIPFQEMRDQVVEGTVDMADAFAASARWVEQRSRAAVVDTAAIEAWLAGREPARPLVAWASTGTPPFEAGDLETYLVTLPAEQVAAVLAGDPGDAARLVESAARNALLLEEARSRGIEATGPQRAAVEDRWTVRAQDLAATLGFAAGAPDRLVKERALAAAADHRQDVLLARTEVRRLTLVLRSLYPVVADPQATDPGRPSGSSTAF